MRQRTSALGSNVLESTPSTKLLGKAPAFVGYRLSESEYQRHSAELGHVTQHDDDSVK
jgi:hypothetical protein